MDSLFVIRTQWQDPSKEEDVKVIRLDVHQEESEISLKINLRKVQSISIKPIKRPLTDVEGHIQAAERLTNEQSP